jgi:predicted dehydrogenase
MKVYNIGLIGRGKMGKAFQGEIEKSNKFNLVKIFSKRDIRKKKQNIRKFFRSNIFDLIIITSPVDSHYQYLNYAMKNKKHIIVEKPLVENFNELKKLSKLNRNFKQKIMIHHNDILNFEKYKIFKKSYKNSKKIEMIYGKKDIKNRTKKPYFDWLPHPLALIVKYFGFPKKFKILNYSKTKKESGLFEELKIEFSFKRLQIYLMFSNFLKNKTKKIFIFKNVKKEIYDGYKKKNQRSIKLLLEKFYKKNKINEISLFFKSYDLLFKIEKNIEKRIIN